MNYYGEDVRRGSMEEKPVQNTSEIATVKRHNSFLETRNMSSLFEWHRDGRGYVHATQHSKKVHAAHKCTTHTDEGHASRT